MLQENLQWVGELTHLGVTGVLGLGITVLWRTYQAEREANVKWQNEAVKHQAEMEQIPEAMDRLRTEILTGMRDLAVEVRAATSRCGPR